MHIRLHDARTLSVIDMGEAYDRLIEFPRARYDRDSQTILLPLYLLRRIVQEFPGATIGPECVTARLAMWRRWVQGYNVQGIWFCYDHDGETVTAVGEGVSPEFRKWIAQRSHILRQFLADQLRPADPTPARNVQPTDGDRLIWNGLQNASRAEAKRADTIERAKVRQRTVKQLRLEGV